MKGWHCIRRFSSNEVCKSIARTIKVHLLLIYCLYLRMDRRQVPLLWPSL